MISNDIIGALIISIIVAVILAIVTAAFRHRRSLIVGFLSTTLYRNKEIRVSIAALLRISQDGHYVLLKSIRRPECFIPVGGVYRFYESAREDLDRCNFRPQEALDSTMSNDLRGFVPGKDLLRFIKWFNSEKDREPECLTREIREELSEIGLKEAASRVEMPKYRLVRSIQERPSSIQGVSYLQYRLIRIHEFVSADPEGQGITRLLLESAEHNDRILVVTADEIRRGRARRGQVIGSIAGYLIGDKRAGPEPPAFS